jgi:CspA family cold shock protein
LFVRVQGGASTAVACAANGAREKSFYRSAPRRDNPENHRQKPIGKGSRMRVRGIVKWYNEAKGFGFIGVEPGPDVFVHFNSIQRNGLRTLPEGATVEFEIVQGKKGPQAEDVRLVEA